MDVICDPIGRFANLLLRFSFPAVALKVPHLCCAARSRNAAAKHSRFTHQEGERAAVVLLTHCFLCAGWRPSPASPPAVRCRPFSRSFQSPSLAMFSARQTSKEPKVRGDRVPFHEAVISLSQVVLLLVRLILYRLWPSMTKVSAAGWRCVIKCGEMPQDSRITRRSHVTAADGDGPPLTLLSRRWF